MIFQPRAEREETRSSHVKLQMAHLTKSEQQDTEIMGKNNKNISNLGNQKHSIDTTTQRMDSASQI